MKLKLAEIILLATMTVSIAHASGYVGIYAVIDKVVFEPAADHPQRVQVFGAFSMAKPGEPTNFQPVQRGYLYFKLPNDPAAAANTLKEWSDLKAVAGTGQAIDFWVFGFNPDQYTDLPKVHKAAEKASDPDVYRTGQGVNPARRDTDYAPIKDLFSAPR
jgi:hypothetical protein